MTCKIKKSLHDKIYQLVTENKLKSIDFFPHHKGLELSIDSSIQGEEKKELEENISEMWYDNEFIYRCSLYPKIIDGVLEITALNENDLVDYGAARENWNFEYLVNNINDELSKHIDEEIKIDNLLLNLEGNGNFNFIINIYALEYYKEGVKEPIVLTNNDEIKSKIINYVESWATNNLYNCSEDDINYRIEISESYLYHLDEYWSSKLDLEIVEN